MKIDNSVDPKRAAVTAAIMFVLVTSFVMGLSSPLASQGARGIGGIEGNADSAYEIGLWGDLPYSAIQETVGLPNLGTGCLYAGRQRLDGLRSAQQRLVLVAGTSVT